MEKKNLAKNVKHHHHQTREKMARNMAALETCAHQTLFPAFVSPVHGNDVGRGEFMELCGRWAALISELRAARTRSKKMGKEKGAKTGQIDPAPPRVTAPGGGRRQAGKPRRLQQPRT